MAKTRRELERKNFKIVFHHHHSFNVSNGLEFVRSPKCGAINTFIGTIRDTDIKFIDPNQDQVPIEAIHYEAYEEMALDQIADILEQTVNSPNPEEPSELALVDTNSRAYVAVRLGKVPAGEESILICVSSTGSLYSHKATMAILKAIKSRAAIWKQIIFADGHKEWVGAAKSQAAWLREEDKR